MGRAACTYFQNAGYTVWGIDCSNTPSVDGVHMLHADLTSEAALQAAFETVAAQTDTLHGIVHMAGFYNLDSLLEISEADFTGIFDVNLFGAYRVNRIFLPLLKKDSRIVIVSSELAPLDPLPFTGIYAITKTALEHYAYSLRMELHLHNIHVSLIRPGAVQTGMLGASTRALEQFVQKTKRYPYHAQRFRNIVDRVEARNIPPEKIAQRAHKALCARHPRYVYNINRNPLLRLLNLLPQRLQVALISMVLKTKQGKAK